MIFDFKTYLLNIKNIHTKLYLFLKFQSHEKRILSYCESRGCFTFTDKQE